MPMLADRSNPFMFMQNRAAANKFAPENNVTKLHPSAYLDPEVQAMEMRERQRVRNMELQQQASDNRAKSSQAMYRTSDKKRKRTNGARSGSAIRQTLEYLRTL